jgi:hypothetical protein
MWENPRTTSAERPTNKEAEEALIAEGQISPEDIKNMQAALDHVGNIANNSGPGQLERMGLDQAKLNLVHMHAGNAFNFLYEMKKARQELQDAKEEHGRVLEAVRTDLLERIAQAQKEAVDANAVNVKLQEEINQLKLTLATQVGIGNGLQLGMHALGKGITEGMIPPQSTGLSLNQLIGGGKK